MLRWDVIRFDEEARRAADVREDRGEDQADRKRMNDKDAVGEDSAVEAHGFAERV